MKYPGQTDYLAHPLPAIPLIHPGNMERTEHFLCFLYDLDTIYLDIHRQPTRISKNPLHGKGKPLMSGLTSQQQSHIRKQAPQMPIDQTWRNTRLEALPCRPLELHHPQPAGFENGQKADRDRHLGTKNS